MRRIGLFAYLACTLVATVAEAQQRPPPPPGGPARSSTQFTLRREEAGGNDAAAARGFARAGDCAAALPAFDAALRSAIDPALRRDRGLCHEKLGHPFPAIDDYRAYLSASPEASDADQIRQRLAALEGQLGTPAKSRQDNPEMNDASVNIGGEGVTYSSTKGSNQIGPKAGEDPKAYDYYVQQEKLNDAAQNSPLRYGTGFVLGPFLHLPRFFIGDGAPTDVAYAAGFTFRYSLGKVVSLNSEIGFAGIGVQGENSARSGPLLLGGIELRIPVSRLAGDHLLLRGGVGFERYVVSQTRGFSNNLPVRFAFGYRHVFGPAVGLEVLADGGPVVVFPEFGSAKFNAVIGASFAFVVGF